MGERSQIKECLDSGFVPSWLTKETTALLQKDKHIASNYRPITCLSLIWKLLSGVGKLLHIRYMDI